MAAGTLEPCSGKKTAPSRQQSRGKTSIGSSKWNVWLEKWRMYHFFKTKNLKKHKGVRPKKEVTAVGFGIVFMKCSVELWKKRRWNQRCCQKLPFIIKFSIWLLWQHCLWRPLFFTKFFHISSFCGGALILLETFT